MKKLLVVLLSLGLIVSLSTGVSAQTTFKMGGAFELRGEYDDNNNVGGDKTRFSRATLWNQVRLMPTFNIAEGLSFTLRLDALEKVWGDTSWKSSNSLTTVDETSSRKSEATGATVDATSTSTAAQVSPGPAKVQQNIEFERGYVDFKTGIGQFIIGYQEAGTWGTKFGDYNITRPRLRYQVPITSSITMIAIWEKNIEGDGFTRARADVTYVPGGVVDADTDSYYLAGIWKSGAIEAGLLYGTTLGNTTRLAATPYRIKLQTLQPYVKATFGPIYFEGEFDYMFGKAREYEIETAAARNQDKAGWGAYAQVKYTMGPAYVGLLGLYNSGDQGDDPSQDKSGTWSKDVNPAIIMGHNDRPDALPGSYLSDNPGATGTNSKKEQWAMYSLFAGYKLTPKLTFDTAISMANTTVKFKGGRFVGISAGNAPGTAGREYVSDAIGTEFDVSATYKIFDNLSYFVGAGYLWTGDFFKGTDPNKEIGNDYTVMHKLTMGF